MACRVLNVSYTLQDSTLPQRCSRHLYMDLGPSCPPPLSVTRTDVWTEIKN